MAKNYTMAEMVQVLADNENANAVQDIIKRYSLLSGLILKLLTKAQQETVDLFSVMPDSLTANKFNSYLKKNLLTDEDEEEEQEEEKPKAKTEKKRGRPPKKQVEDDDEDEGFDDEDEEEEEAGKYDGKSAVELYTLCKKRKIKAETKKPAKYYIALLEEADELENFDDDWQDDEEDEKPKKKQSTEKKRGRGRPPKSESKPAKKKQPEPDEDDDDDDWEI